MKTYDQLVQALANKLDSLDKRNRHSLWLKEIEPTTQNCAEEIMRHGLPRVYDRSQRKQSLTELSGALGSLLRARYKLVHSSLHNVFGGLIFLELLVQEKYLKLVFEKDPGITTKSGYKNYRLVDTGKGLEGLLDGSMALGYQKRIGVVQYTPPIDWASNYCLGRRMNLVRTNWAEFTPFLTKQEQPILFKALNKLQNTAYKVNEEVFAIYKQAFSWTEESPFSHVAERKETSKASKLFEAKTIKQIAGLIEDKTFYHNYWCDFRGRIYPNTAQFHEQSSDNAKGLIKYARKVPLGDHGWYWLCVQFANSMGHDKVSLDKRVEYTESKLGEIAMWSLNAEANRSWTQADKPWSALAAGLEIEKVMQFMLNGGDRREFESDLPVFIDGSCNGLQHLTALVRDEKTAPLVNLCASKDQDDIPGDIYMFVANKVWDELELRLQELTEEELEEAKLLISELSVAREHFNSVSGNKAKRNAAFEAILAIQAKYSKEAKKSAWIPFWIAQKSLRRKIVKRCVMTLPYGVTRSGAKSQVQDDTYGLNDAMTNKENFWASLLGGLLFDTCFKELVGPGATLALFRALAQAANGKAEHLSWMVPVTNFPVMQNYSAATNTKRNITFAGKRIQLKINIYESTKVDKNKQKLGTPPNIIHSFDAAHAALIVTSDEFDITTVHDSFGCHAGNMQKLFANTRETFVRFYKTEPLKNLLTQLNSLHLMPNQGTLDLDEIIDSQFAFC